MVGLVRRWLKAGVVSSDGLRRTVTTGTPQGGVISPLLANVYLHRLDKEVKAAGFRLVRYADDFVVLANRRWKVRMADQLIRALLADMHLSLNEAKSAVRHLERDKVEFLGFEFYAGRFLRPRPRAIASFKNQIRALTRRKAGIALQAMIEGVNSVIRGWGNYFVDGHVAHLFRQLDKWVRMRLRSYMSKRRAQSFRMNTLLKTATLERMGLVTLVNLRQAKLSSSIEQG